jgi:hypothetical protein
MVSIKKGDKCLPDMIQCRFLIENDLETLEWT